MPLPPDQVFYVTPAQIKDWRDRDEAVIVDVREDNEWQEAHIPGARFFDIDEISDQRSDLPHMAPPPEKNENTASGFRAAISDR